MDNRCYSSNLNLITYTQNKIVVEIPIHGYREMRIFHEDKNYPEPPDSVLKSALNIDLDRFEDEMMRNCRQTTFPWTAASSLTSCAADVRRKNSLP